jgi:hypothetical protein
MDAVLLGLLTVLLAGGAWVRSQWYVGVSDGSVAVYQGVSTFPALSTLVNVTDIPVADLPPLEAGLVSNGISAQSQSGADAIVAGLRDRACVAIPRPAYCPPLPIPTPVPAPTATPSPTATP